MLTGNHCQTWSMDQAPVCLDRVRNTGEKNVLEHLGRSPLRSEGRSGC
jgi:hypothetical protein